MPSNRDISNALFSLDEKSGIDSATELQTAKPIGSNISVVEVFITHILINADTTIKPPTNIAPLLPTLTSILKANLLCKPDASIPSASMNPPRKRYIFGFEYGIAAVLISATPKIGKRVIGSRAVTATGTASVAHHVAINNVTAATIQPTSDKPDGVGESKTTKKSIIPTQKPFFLNACIILIFL